MTLPGNDGRGRDRGRPRAGERAASRVAPRSDPRRRRGADPRRRRRHQPAGSLPAHGLYPPPPARRRRSDSRSRARSRSPPAAGAKATASARCSAAADTPSTQSATRGTSLPMPRGLSFVQAAALPETVFTVYANVFESGALAPHETLLVHGATSGIGVTAMYMAKAAGARVVGTLAVRRRREPSNGSVETSRSTRATARSRRPCSASAAPTSCSIWWVRVTSPKRSPRSSRGAASSSSPHSAETRPRCRSWR